jgi:hypothetical protein
VARSTKPLILTTLQAAKRPQLVTPQRATAGDGRKMSNEPLEREPGEWGFEVMGLAGGNGLGNNADAA